MSWWRKIFPEYVKPADIVIELKYDPSNKHFKYTVGYNTDRSSWGYDYKCVHTGDDYDEALAKYNEIWDNFERVGKKVADRNGLRVGHAQDQD